jgi:hypothetical protein
MRQNIVLIDFENVQPESVALLSADHFRVLVFVGANQAKVPFETAASLQQLGARAEYIKISGNGSNALDFHIAYYIGKLAAADPAAFFHIVSKDTGFDPLIAHLKTNKVFAGRVKEIRDIPVIRAANNKSPEERVAIVLDKLRQPKVTKPRTVKTLSSAVAQFLQKQVGEEEIAEVIGALVRAGAVVIEGAKVSYANLGDA